MFMTGVLCTVCGAQVYFRLIGKTRWPPWPLIGWDIFDFSSETAEQNSTKLDRKQDLNVLYQVCVFRADRKNKKIPALASDLLRHFRLLFWNCLMEFKETWQEARSQRPLPSLYFSGQSEKQDGCPGRFLKKVAHCTQVHDMWPFGPLLLVRGSADDSLDRRWVQSLHENFPKTLEGQQMILRMGGGYTVLMKTCPQKMTRHTLWRIARTLDSWSEGHNIDSLYLLTIDGCTSNVLRLMTSLVIWYPS